MRGGYSTGYSTGYSSGAATLLGVLLVHLPHLKELGAALDRTHGNLQIVRVGAGAGVWGWGWGWGWSWGWDDDWDWDWDWDWGWDWGWWLERGAWGVGRRATGDGSGVGRVWVGRSAEIAPYLQIGRDRDALRLERRELCQVSLSRLLRLQPVGR